MLDPLQKDIINWLQVYGKQGCFVNQLFRNLRCSKTDFVTAKDKLIKQGVINTTKEGKQKIRLSLNSGYFSELDESFRYTLKTCDITVNDALKRLRRLKPLFKHTDDKYEFSGVKVTHSDVRGLLEVITGVLESLSHHIMAYTIRYHLDLNVRKSDLKENQRLGFETMQCIIEKLIEQHKEEEKELRSYLMWGMTTAFSYVF
jgi:hypothetical protein